MRWVHIRHAKIDPDLRQTFEDYGVEVMRSLLATQSNFVYQHSWSNPGRVRDELLTWLTEQRDRAERKETWWLTLEVTIAGLVAAELVLLLAR